ncbi:MAG: PIG-L deacetylase family protein [Veillonella sp.]
MNNKTCDNGFFHQSLADTNVLVVVPHQDDEINLMRDLLVSLQNCKATVYVAYTTNGDYSVPANVRYQEAIESLRILGVPKEQIIFLGYGDSFNTAPNRHIFYADSEPSVSNAGYSETYGAEGIEELVYQVTGHHHEYLKDNYIADMELLLKQINPAIIFGIDYDTHPDHRMLSLGLDTALRNMRAKDSSFKPVVYKGFAYVTAFHSYPDFYDSINLESIKEPREPHTYHYFGDRDVYGSSIYEWKNRVRFPVNEGNRGPFLWNSPLFNAIKAHTSQSFGFKALAVINSDIVFWQRRTDSIAYDAELEVSSNSDTKDRLVDFKLFDILDINSLEPVLNPLAWTPSDEDTQPSIQLTWNKAQDIRQIVLYSAIDFDESCRECTVYIDDRQVGTGIVLPKGHPLVLSLDTTYHGNQLRLVFDGPITLAELEVYATAMQDNPLQPFIKIVKDDNFIYDYYVDDEKQYLHLSVYAYMADAKDVTLSIDGESTIERDGDGYMIRFSRSTREVIVRATLNGNEACYDQVVIHRVSKQALGMRKRLQQLDKYANLFFLRLRRKWYHLFQKQ